MLYTPAVTYVSRQRNVKKQRAENIQKTKPALKKTLMAVACLSTIPVAQAAVSLGRTRTIFNGDEKLMTLNIANDNKQLPYLAQAWVENEKEEKTITGPIITILPVQCLKSGSKSMVRLTSIPDISRLPQDKESLFYSSLREIPPRSNKASVLQIALQTKVKLFYRSESIKAKPNAVWQDQLVLNKISGGYRVDNPTSYYVTVIGIGGIEKQAREGEFDTVMLAPKSMQMVKSGIHNTPYLSHINDYGGRPVLQFSYGGSRCTAVKK